MEKGNKIILVLGVLAIAAGIFVRFNAAAFQKKAVLTEGTVIHVIGSSYNIRYITAEGTVKVYQGSGKTHGFREGDTVKAWYLIRNPDRVRFSDGKPGAKKMFIAGAICILLGVYPLFMKKEDASMV